MLIIFHNISRKFKYRLPARRFIGHYIILFACESYRFIILRYAMCRCILLYSVNSDLRIFLLKVHREIVRVTRNFGGRKKTLKYS